MNCSVCGNPTEFRGTDPLCVRHIAALDPSALMEPLYTEVEMHPVGKVKFRVASAVVLGVPELADMRAQHQTLRGEYRAAILTALAARIAELHPDATRSPSSIGETFTVHIEGDGRRELNLLGVYIGTDRALRSDDDPQIASLLDALITVDPPYAYEGRNDFQLVAPSEQASRDTQNAPVSSPNVDAPVSTEVHDETPQGS